MSKIIPNVFMYWCQHKAKCKWCEQDVVAGTPIIQVMYWNRGLDFQGKKVRKPWTIKRYYHPQCYVDQGLDYLKLNPYVPYQRKPKSKLTDEQRELRYVLLKQRASIEQRRRNLDSNYPDKLLEEAKLNEQVSKIMVKIAPIGGIPKKWLD